MEVRAGVFSLRFLLPRRVTRLHVAFIFDWLRCQHGGAVRHRCEPHSRVSVDRPPDGGWSLTPIENLLRGLRNMSDRFSLEVYGGGSVGAVNYLLRSTSGTKLQGLVQSYYPQARAELLDADGKGVHSDWLILAEDENALVMPLWLGGERHMPLKTYADHVLREGEFDPLAGVVSHLSGIGRWTGGDSRDRIGMRLLLHPAPENWARRYQSRIQARRDGDDRTRTGGRDSEQSASNSGGLAIIGLVGVAALAYFNYDFWQSGEFLRLAALDLGVAGAGGLGFWGWRKFGGKRGRDYLDEELVEEKIKSLGFVGELQLIRTYGGGDAEREGAAESLRGFLDVLRQFDNPAGNSWRAGKIEEYSGLDLRHERGDLGLADPALVMRWCSQGRSKNSILSAREVATLWHMPLGMKEMASMDRGQSKVLTPYLEGLDEEGPLVGYTDHGIPVRMPESALEKHTLFLGRSGTGKSTMVKQVVHYKMLQKARGLDDGAIVLVDPHQDLVRDILKVVPPEIAHKVRLLDLGRNDRVPAINLMDPDLFPDRDRCVGTIIQTLKGLWDTWGNRLEEILDRGLKMIYEYNVHADTPRAQMLTMLDLLRLLQDGKVVGQGRDQSVELTAFQKHVLSRVEDAYVRLWFDAFMKWPRDTRAEALGPVMNRIGAYAGDNRAKAVLGQRDSTVVFSDVLREGIILLVSTSSGTIGKQPAALMGGTIISLLDSALRNQETLRPEDRKKCLLIADEFQTITGTDWEGMLAEVRKYKCSLMLATQSLAVLDSPERNLKSGIMSNTACLISYQISAEDAQLVSYQMGHDRVSETDLVMLDPFCCYVRITTQDRALPVFSMKTLPPPEIEHGNDESEQAVVRLMSDYTVDRDTALRRINDEALAAMQGLNEKIGVSGAMVREEQSEVAGGAGAPAPPAGPVNSSGGGNPYSMFMPGAPDTAAASAGTKRGRDSADAVRELLGDEGIAASEFSAEVLGMLYQKSDDPGVRALIDQRLKGRVKHAFQKKEDEYDKVIKDKDAEIERLMSQLQKAESRAPAPVAAPPEQTSEEPDLDFSHLAQANSGPRDRSALARRRQGSAQRRK